MIKIEVKPLSVNEIYKGRRYKTPKYTAYQTEVFSKLPEISLPLPPFELEYEFGLSNSNADYDNLIKAFQDILQKQYNFNDSKIHKATIEKTLVNKGEEYIKFNIKHYADSKNHRRTIKRRSGKTLKKRIKKDH